MIDVIEHEGIINTLAWRTAKSSGVDFQEVRAKAQEIAVMAATRFDPSKSKPSTFLWHCVHNGLLDWVVRECRAANHETLDDVGEPSTDLSPGARIDLWDDINHRLSNEAQEVCRIVLSSPAEAGLSGDATKLQARRTLKRHLLRRGWAGRTIERAFVEIGELLRQRA